MSEECCHESTARASLITAQRVDGTNLSLQAKALVWQEQVEVLTQALQQANAEKAVLAGDKGRLEQDVANLRLQMSVIQKAMEGGQLPTSAPLAVASLPMASLPSQAQPVPPVHPMVQQVRIQEREREQCFQHQSESKQLPLFAPVAMASQLTGPVQPVSPVISMVQQVRLPYTKGACKASKAIHGGHFDNVGQPVSGIPCASRLTLELTLVAHHEARQHCERAPIALSALHYGFCD